MERLLNDSSIDFLCHFCQPIENNGDGMKTLLKEMREMKETMGFMSSQYDAILKGVKRNTESIKTLQNENKSLREDVKHLKSTVAFLNGERVKNDCVINGIKLSEEVNPVDMVMDVARMTGAGIRKEEIDEAYFTRRDKQANKASLVVKFTNKKSKTEFMRDKKKLHEIEGMKAVYVNDFLTKENLDLLRHAKSLRAVGFKFVYVQNGKVMAKKQEKAKAIWMKSMDDIDNMLSKMTVGRRLNLSRNAEDGEMVDDDDDDDDGAGFLSPS